MKQEYEVQLTALEAKQKFDFDQSMRVHTLVGDLTAWRKLKNDKIRGKILSGRAKILTLISKIY